MKLSKETIAIMKNFASINGNLMIKPGSVLSTLSAAKSVFANAKVTEKFDTEFGIYDLNEFLGAISLQDDPDIIFDEKFATIKGDGAFRFYSADPAVLTYPQKEIKMPTPYIEFDLSEKDLNLIIKHGGLIGSSDVSFLGDGETITVVVSDKKNSSSNTFTKDVGQTDKTFVANLQQTNMKFISDDYTVSISEKKIVQLVSERLEYFVSLEADSTFS